jgi:hypothetical protein
LPWTKMRQVYRLLGLARRYGGHAVDTACGRALELDVISVTKIASMLERATQTTPAITAKKAAGSGTDLPPARFARDPAEYATGRLSLLHEPSADGPTSHNEVNL